jgi:hypothetical protein
VTLQTALLLGQLASTTQPGAQNFAALAARRFDKSCFSFHSSLRAGFEKQIPLAMIPMTGLASGDSR